MKSGIFLIPSLLTALNMGLGFYSITASINGQWHVAAWCILAAIVFDVFDGRVARWTNSTSKFGVEFDSLADWVSFGIAPALMMYLIVLKDLGRIGFAISLLFILCGALRLAKFNLKSLMDEDTQPYFVGLPIPAAGGILASFIILYDIMVEDKEARTIHLVMKQLPAFYHLLPGIIFVLALLMVSNIQYSSFKKMNLFKPKSSRAFLMMVFVGLIIYIYPQNAIFVLFVAYICSGLIDYFWRGYRLRSGVEELQIRTPSGESWEIKRKDKYYKNN